MFSIRRAALSILSKPSTSFVSKPRTISTAFPSSSRVSRATTSIQFQRRWASDEAKEVPVSKLQPTAAEEVENAINSDNAAAPEGTVEPAASSSAAGESSGVATQSGSEAIPEPAEDPIDQEDPRDTVESRRRSIGDVPLRDRSREFGVRDVQPKKTIYVGNLFFDVTEDDLTKELSRFGKIEHVRLIRDARGLSKGFGYATFESIEQATDAINGLNQQKFEGRRMNLQYAAQDSPPRPSLSRPEQTRVSKNPPSKTLFIGNMSWDMTDRDLNDLFRPIRNVIDVRIAIDRRTGQPRGFAHADFIDVKSAMEAEKILQGKETYGRKLRIDYSYGSSRAPRNEARDNDRGFNDQGSTGGRDAADN